MCQMCHESVIHSILCHVCPVSDCLLNTCTLSSCASDSFRERERDRLSRRRNVDPEVKSKYIVDRASSTTLGRKLECLLTSSRTYETQSSPKYWLHQWDTDPSCHSMYGVSTGYKCSEEFGESKSPCHWLMVVFGVGDRVGDWIHWLVKKKKSPKTVLSKLLS